ncbi:hypothetical protein H1D32_13795 [Anaerobacillus sp. CMMVII]|uniref:hypothetical protein n=1 Tax=Anaerobacillus sp. CMMVII TaxID=2755588 RepID=UPI0021B74C1E|nr:hypothetical protein [Anaerobacillus sp. CMMVII]MCT8138717.1 hypothetical protein [Anaerobacillus sp. CMMVII]
MVVLLVPIILWVCGAYFKRVGWKVTNYQGDEIPYHLGFCIFLLVLGYAYIVNNVLVLIYLTVLWVTGFIDDRYGTKYPKGLKGHISLFLKTGKMTTGLLKLTSTLAVSMVFVSVIELRFLEQFVILLLLILPPHVMNLFDTRPLRVWKVIAIHALLYIPFILQMSFSLLFTVGFILSALVYIEGTRRGMLGDNGATLLGGIMGVIAVYQLPFFAQGLLICFYLFIIIVTEKISLSKWIEERPLLRKIDRWGIS